MEKAKTTKNVKEEDWSPQKVAEYSFYQNAWHQIAHNSQKTILSLSAGAIGLLIGISNFLSFSSILQIVVFCVALVFLYMTIMFIGSAWQCNVDILKIRAEQVKQDSTGLRKELKNLYKKNNKSSLLFVWHFWLSLISLMIFTGITIYEKYDSKAKENPIKQVQVIGPVQTYPVLQKTK